MRRTKRWQDTLLHVTPFVYILLSSFEVFPRG
jgi:hypothetical protein